MSVLKYDYPIIVDWVLGLIYDEILKSTGLWFLRIFPRVHNFYLFTNLPFLNIFLKEEKVPPRKERSSLYCLQTSSFLFVVSSLRDPQKASTQALAS